MAVTEALCMKTAWGSCCTGLPVPKPCLCVHTSGSLAQGLHTPRSNLHGEKEHESWAIAPWGWGGREGDDLLPMRVRFLFCILTAYVTRLGGSENDFSAGKKKRLELLNYGKENFLKFIWFCPAQSSFSYRELWKLAGFWAVFKCHFLAACLWEAKGHCSTTDYKRSWCSRPWFQSCRTNFGLMVSLLHTFNWNRCEKYWHKSHYYSAFPVSLWCCLMEFEMAVITSLNIHTDVSSSLGTGIRIPFWWLKKTHNKVTSVFIRLLIKCFY